MFSKGTYILFQMEVNLLVTYKYLSTSLGSGMWYSIAIMQVEFSNMLMASKVREMIENSYF